MTATSAKAQTKPVAFTMQRVGRGYVCCIDRKPLSGKPPRRIPLTWWVALAIVIQGLVYTLVKAVMP